MNSWSQATLANKLAAPPIDPKLLGLVGSAAKPLVEKGLEKVANKAEKAATTASESFKVLGREVEIICPESTQHYSMALEAKQAGFFGGKAKFNIGSVKRASIRPIMGMQPVGAIRTTEDGFEIDLKKLKPGETYILDTEYKLDEPRFIDSLVLKEVAKETVTVDSTEYWMVAQLRFVDVLRGHGYGRVDLRDLEFSVNVGVHQDVSTKVPPLFKEQLEALVKLAGPLGKDEVFRAIQHMRYIKSRKYGTNSLDLLGDIIETFEPQAFRRYIEVNPDFRYSDCVKGTAVYDLPLGVWPKFMTVTSRTDLGLEKPAAKGTLVYKRKDFLKVLEDLFK